MCALPYLIVLTISYWSTGETNLDALMTTLITAVEEHHIQLEEGDAERGVCPIIFFVYIDCHLFFLLSLCSYMYTYLLLGWDRCA